MELIESNEIWDFGFANKNKSAAPVCAAAAAVHRLHQDKRQRRQFSFSFHFSFLSREKEREGEEDALQAYIGYYNLNLIIHTTHISGHENREKAWERDFCIYIQNTPNDLI